MGPLYVERMKRLTSAFPSTNFNNQDWNLPGSSVHGIFQARILEWVATLGDLPKPGIESGSPALQADSILSELPGIV